MSEMFGAEFTVGFCGHDHDVAFLSGAEAIARRELCNALAAFDAKVVDRDSNGNLLVAFNATREHLRDIYDRMSQSVSYGDFDARYLCVWPDPDGEMLTGEALRAWLEED